MEKAQATEFLSVKPSKINCKNALYLFSFFLFSSNINNNNNSINRLYYCNYKHHQWEIFNRKHLRTYGSFHTSQKLLKFLIISAVLVYFSLFYFVSGYSRFLDILLYCYVLPNTKYAPRQMHLAIICVFLDQSVTRNQCIDEKIMFDEKVARHCFVCFPSFWNHLPKLLKLK